jgi:hypothetical protein
MASGGMKMKIPNRAEVLAEEYGLSDMAKKGLGYGWQQDFVRSALRTNFNPVAMMENNGAQMVGAGMENSGAFQVKLPAQIAATGVGVAGNAANQAWAQNENFASRAQGMEFQLAQARDSMELQATIAERQIEAMEPSFWDHFMGAASLGVNLIGL